MSEIDRRVARAREVRQCQPGLHVHRRRTDLAQPRVVLRRLRVCQQNTTPQRQTAGPDSRGLSAEHENKFSNIRGTVQLRRRPHGVGEVLPLADRRLRRTTTGARPSAGEREALTAQNQTAKNWAGAVQRRAAATTGRSKRRLPTYSSRIDVGTFESSGRLANAPIENQADSKAYNGATFDGFVDRPRQQFNVASNWFLTPGGKCHDVKVGFDFQNLESGAQFQYPNAQYLHRRQLQPGDGRRSARSSATDLRDRAIRFDRQDLRALRPRQVPGHAAASSSKPGSDGRSRPATATSAPTRSTPTSSRRACRRASTCPATARRCITGSYGRYYASIIQGFSDAFASVPQQENYDLFIWNGSSYRVHRIVCASAGRTSQPNTRSEAVPHGRRHRRRSSASSAATWAAGVRFIARKWDDLIDDIRTFRPDGSINRASGQLRCRRAQLQAACSSRSRSASRTTGTRRAATPTRRPTGNHFGDNFTALGDYLDAQCRTTVDPTIGTDGVDPVRRGATTGQQDRSADLRSSAQLQAERAPTCGPIGPVNLTFGALTELHLEAPLRAAAHASTCCARAPRRNSGQTRDVLLRRAWRTSSSTASRTTSTSPPKPPGASRARIRPASRPRSSTSPTTRRRSSTTTWRGAARFQRRLHDGRRELRQGDRARLVPRAAAVPLLADLSLLGRALGRGGLAPSARGIACTQDGRRFDDGEAGSSKRSGLSLRFLRRTLL